ncbi:bifunctional riboflavin kinase/FAD synthetase [Bacillus solimangrovi]|uniref:Riboflavin biosynthesis protein n=1 Tax=Bacillus solimangrovi TaxID=1305675 RepID=A0A1E5LE30_9BACI|nr:bifunctional riboflavin kinase/FAD synthetase [Bacillus solimangrovi]OEH92314.1 riboflavin biosynthesis protein RibF [Bacillus solimangrovi]
MKVIHLSYPHQLAGEEVEDKAMALGFFDGVHLGHQKVILTAKHEAEKRGIKSAVMTFYPHPSVILRKQTQHVRYITPQDEKVRQIEQLGIDELYIVQFDKSFAELFPQEFVDEFIIHLKVKHVVAGFDFSYGRLGKGTMETLPFHSREFFTQTVVSKVANNDEKVSSSLIREKIHLGAVHQIPDLLGRHYEVQGLVVDGDKRGRTIGFPTANVQASDKYLMPPVGVYAVKMLVNGLWLDGVCNLGYKPTFHDDKVEPILEVHVFDFNADIYGKTVTVKWLQRIREEKKFTNVDELIIQIKEDKAKAEKILANM